MYSIFDTNYIFMTVYIFALSIMNISLGVFEHVEFELYDKAQN